MLSLIKKNNILQVVNIFCSKSNTNFVAEVVLLSKLKTAWIEAEETVSVRRCFYSFISQNIV